MHVRLVLETLRHHKTSKGQFGCSYSSSATMLEQPDDALLAFEIRKLTQPERSYPPHLLKLLVVIHAHKALRPGPTY